MNRILFSMALLLGCVNFLPIDVGSTAQAQELALEEIKDRLLDNPPDTGDPNVREQAILDFDAILKNDAARTSSHVKDFYNFMVEKVQTELYETVGDWAAIWMMYNHGFVVKTRQHLFAFDLVDGYGGWRLPSELIEQIEVLFISHVHGDHYHSRVAQAVIANGGSVVVPREDSYMGNVPMASGDTLTIAGLHTVAHFGLHSVPVRVFEVTCPNGLKILHTGDNQTSTTLPWVDDVEVLLLNAWVNESGGATAVDGMRNSIRKIAASTMIPGHIQELGHAYNPNVPATRVPYEWALEVDDEPIPSEVKVMVWGERYFVPARHEVKIITPVAGRELSGVAEVKWSSPVPVENVTTTLEVSRDAGQKWQAIATVTSTDTTLLWNTADVPDGTRYLLRVSISGDGFFAAGKNQGRFTINNPGNGVPDVEVLSPEARDHVSGVWPIRWLAEDADGNELTLSVDYSADDGATWITTYTNLPNSGEFSWDSRLAPNSRAYRLRINVSDDAEIAADTSGTFEVLNERTDTIPSTAVTHLSGNSAARITPQIIDQVQLTGHVYRIMFDDTLFENKVYEVRDMNTGVTVVDNATQLDGVTEGPFFDGMRLLIKDLSVVSVDLDSTGWTVGESTLEFSISVPKVLIGGELIEGRPYAADYRITLFDHIVDTTSTAFGLEAKPVNFTVWNLTEKRDTEFLFTEFDNNQTISDLDKVTFLGPDEDGELHLAWAIFFSGRGSHVSPVPGDQFTFSTLKPLTSADVYEFRGSLLTSVAPNDLAQLPKESTLFQNYPNPFNPETEIRFQIPKSSDVILKVYNLLGQEVRTLRDQRYLPGEYSITWDGKDSSGKGVASGIYLYRLEAGNFSQVRKMTLLR